MSNEKITLPHLFHGELLAGLQPQRWETMTLAERMTARLEFIEVRARTLADLPYSQDNNVPANVHSIARRLQQTAIAALDALSDGDPYLAAWQTLEAGKLMESVAKTLAVAKALDVTRELAENEPHIVRGKKQIQSASNGGKAKAKWPERSGELQKVVNAIHAKHSEWSYEEIKRRAHVDHGYPLSALKRYTYNPRK